MLRSWICKSALHFPWLLRFLPTPIPIATRQYRCSDESNAATLIVFLPGIGDVAEDYERYGFLETAQREGWPADLTVVDAHYGYYANRTILDRLHEDIFEPARELGYRHRCLVGISLGGFGALLYASRYASDITGVVAIAPFLGQRGTIADILTAGGIRQWVPGGIAEHDYERQLWAWLKQYGSRPAELPTLCLAYGSRDTFAEAHGVLKEVLPSKQVFVEPGGHDWFTWQKLWGKIVRADCLHPERMGL